MKKIIPILTLSLILFNCGIPENKYEEKIKENEELKSENSRLENEILSLRFKNSIQEQFSEQEVYELTQQYLEKENDACIEYVTFNKIIGEKLTNGNWYVYVTFTDKSGEEKFKDKFFNKKSTNKYIFEIGQDRSYNIKLMSGTIPFCG